MREILAVAVKAELRLRLGDALAALGSNIGLTNHDFELVGQVLAKAPAEPPSLDR